MATGKVFLLNSHLKTERRLLDEGMGDLGSNSHFASSDGLYLDLKRVVPVESPLA